MFNSTPAPKDQLSSATLTPVIQLSANRAARAAINKRDAEYDRGLVSRFISGDESAFVEITERYREKTFSIAVALIRNAADAEEIVQDTFLRVYRGLHNFRGDSSLATWLHRITVNLARNRYWYFHRRARHATISLDAPLGAETNATLGELLSSEARTPASEMATVEFSALVTVCMQKLHSAHREILVLRNILNQSYKDIAAALGIQQGTVKSRIARARGLLKALLAQACPEFSPQADPSEWFEHHRPSSPLVVAT